MALRMVRRFGPPIIALVAVLVGPTATLAAPGSVTIQGFAFQPESVTVNEGDTVTWTNEDGATHTATADGGSFDTGHISGSGGTASVTFATAGTFTYHCAIHPSMTGTIVVAAASATSRPTARVTNPPTDSDADVPTAAPRRDGVPGSLVVLSVAAFLAILGVGRRRRAAR